MGSIRRRRLCFLFFFVVLLQLRSSQPKTSSSSGPSSTLEPPESPDKFVSFCETETFHATCAVDEVIVITHARYGRMRISRCVKLDYGHLGCVSDVIELADSRCSGRRRCEIRIPDSEFAKHKPCPDDLKPYLEIGHKCIKVQTSTDFCTYPQATPVTSSQSGHLASLVTEMTGCGGVTTPWIIEVSPGQVVRLTLYDFGVVRTKKGLTRPASSTQCHTYAILREPGQQHPGPGGVIRTVRNVTVCGGSMRQSVVYVTVTNRLEIGLVRNENLIYGPHFMFEYHAIGCPDLPSLHNAWYIRSGDSLTVKCNFSKDVHQMKCKHNTWIGGDKWNCTGIHSAANVDKLAKTGMSIPYGLSVLIILVIALAIGAFVLCVGLLFLRRKATGSCMDGGADDPSPVTPFANKHFVRSSIVRNLTGSVALHPDKLPWKNTLVSSHYGSNTDMCSYAHCLSSHSGDRTGNSPPNSTSTFPPPPYCNLRRNLPCGCTPIWESSRGEMCDVTSCTLAHDRGKDDGTPLTEYFVLENRKQRAYASSILQLNLLQRRDLDLEAEGLDQQRIILAAGGKCPPRPTSLVTSLATPPVDEKTNDDVGRLLRTISDVTAVPEIVSDCRQNDVVDASTPISNYDNDDDDDTL